jgi:hypothetical protein
MLTYLYHLGEGNHGLWAYDQGMLPLIGLHLLLLLGWNDVEQLILHVEYEISSGLFQTGMLDRLDQGSWQ